MSDLEFYIRLATGWACHHPAGFWLAVSLLSISVLICWAIRAPLIPNEIEPQDTPRDDECGAERGTR